MKHWFIILTLLLSTNLFAQVNRPKFEAAAAFDTTMNLSVTTGDIRVNVDKFSGRFSIERADGTPILFTRNGLATSYTNVRIAYQTFTNNTLYSPQSPAGTRSIPSGHAEIENNSIVFRTTIQSQVGAVDLEQRYIPTVENTYHFIRITTKLKNQTPFTIPLGTLHVFDLMAGGSDYADVNIDNKLITLETGFTGSAIPSQIEISSLWIPFKIHVRLSGNGIVKPDQLVIGRWQYNGYLGAASWDYIPSGRNMLDNAMLMQWNQVAIQPQQDFIVSTDYGLESYIQKPDAKISCYLAPVIWNDSTQSYQPNPFDVRGRVTNTGSTAITGFVCVLGPLLNGLYLASGETATKSIPGTINPGASADIIWRIQSPVFTQDTIVQIPIRIAQPPMFTDTCIGQITIPAARIKRIVSAELYCGPKIQLQKDNVGAGYDPNPFFIEPIITNTGTEYLDSLYITIVLPPKLTLISGAQSQLLNPFPLNIGSNIKPIWVVQAAPDFTADSVEYILRLTNKQGINLECRQKVFLPPVDIVMDCNENGPSTRGKEFWFSFGWDVATQGLPYSPDLRIIVAAEKHTDIRIESPFNQTIISHIFPKNTIQYYVDKTLASTNNSIDTRYVHLSASEPVSVAIVQSSSVLSEVSSVLPIDALGLKHTLFGYADRFTITATQNTTSINNGALILHQGQMMRQAQNDGTFIDADKPISILRHQNRVTSFLNIPATDGNALIEFIPPHEILGKEYIAIPLLSRFGGDYVQIYSSDDGNVVRINGTAYPLTARGSNKSFLLQKPTYISADKPVGVMQFSMPTFFDKPLNATPYGDGSMVCLMSVDRFSTCHSFTTAMVNTIDWTAITLVIHDGGQRFVSLDGMLISDTLFHPVPNALFRYARIVVSKGTHRVGTTDPRGIGVVVYGFGLMDAYSYNAGFLITKKGPVPTNVNETGLPSEIGLRQNYPNPFGEGSETRSPVTNIVFNTKGGHVTLRVFDMLGREVATFIDALLDAGEHTIIFDAQTKYGLLPSGIYLYQLETVDVKVMKKMIVVR